jgi:hypothetical protein
LGGLLIAGSIGALAYARQQHQLMESAAQKVAGRSLDSLNVASLRRRLNRSLMLQEAQNEAIIDGEDLTIRWKCIGYCRADRETSIEFSIDTDNNIPFDELNCFAYDLRRDPEKTHRIPGEQVENLPLAPRWIEQCLPACAFSILKVRVECVLDRDAFWLFFWLLAIFD